jgi:hypothetical protein
VEQGLAISSAKSVELIEKLVDTLAKRERQELALEQDNLEQLAKCAEEALAWARTVRE